MDFNRENNNRKIGERKRVWRIRHRGRGAGGRQEQRNLWDKKRVKRDKKIYTTRGTGHKERKEKISGGRGGMETERKIMGSKI